MTVRAGVDGAGGAGGGAGGSGTLTASGLSLPVNQLLLGNTYPDTKPLGTLGTTTTLLHGNAAGAPTFAAVSLTADVTGTLPVANGGTGITSLGTGVATFLGTPSSANLLAAVTGATGTGAAVFGTSPTFTTGLTTPVATITQGTISADAPLLDLSSTWNGAGIVGPAIKLNVTDTSSNASALLADLGVGGGSYVSKWKLDKTGKVTQTGNLLGPNGTGAAPTYSFASSTGTGMYLSTALELGIGLGSLYYDFTQNYFSLRGSNTLKLGFGTSIDTQLQRDGTANIHAWRNGANANTGRIYNTYTSSTSFERLSIDWTTTANLARLMTEKGSGGGTARAMALGTDSINRITIDALGNVAMNGENAALATTATDGYLSIPTCAGPPTGVPTAKTGAVQLHYDITNDKLWIYNGGWKQPKTPAGAAIVTWQ